MLEISCRGSIILMVEIVCKIAGLNGSNKEQGFLVEEVYDSVGDTLREIIRFFFEKDETKKVYTLSKTSKSQTSIFLNTQ